MPSRSATSLVDMTSVRVSGRAAGVAIYLREARSRQTRPPGADFGSRLRGLANESRSGGGVGSTGIHTLGGLPVMATLLKCRNHAKGAANVRRRSER
jgi:hypothetical protein